MALPNAPQSRNEKYLAKIAGQEVELPNEPLSREEEYLEYIAKNGGGGGGYTLPTATSERLGGIKVGSGLNVEEDGTLSTDGESSLEAGNYIEIDANGKINVKMEKGDTTEYEYRFTAEYSPEIKLTIEKYSDGELISTESYLNDASYTPIAIDGLFEIWYTAGSPRYYWHYKLLENSQEHSAGYEDSWFYTDTTTRTETFDVEDDSLTLVRKCDLAPVAELKTLHLSSGHTDGNGVRGTGLNIEDVVIVGVSSGDSSSDLMWNLGMKNVSGGKHEYTIRFFRPSGELCSNMNFWVDVFYYDI